MRPFVDPAMAPILEEMRAAPQVDYAAISIADARKIFDAGAARWRALCPGNLIVDELTVAGAAGPLRARLYRPTAARLPLIIYVHGGGWTFGSVDSHENEMRYLALGSGAAVLGFDYRLAPEWPFPAALDDTLAVIRAVREGLLGDLADASRMAMAGDSAGAHLALAAMLGLRDRGEELPCASALFYGCYAPRYDGESHELFGSGMFGLSSPRIRWYWENFLGETVASPLAAPLDATFDGLPPAYLAAAGLDPLRDDTIALARGFEAAGVSHAFSVVPGVIHGFLGRAPRLPAAQQVLREAGVFLAKELKREENKK